MAETELEMVRRHVREGAANVTSQRRVVSALKGRGALLAKAKALLATYEELQDQHIAHLARLTGGAL